MSTARRGGFTLVELMVVVAIIALLISILLPSLAKARQQAYQVKCASNLHSIFQGIFYYAEDQSNGKGHLPQLTLKIDMYPGAYWAYQIRPYVKIARSRVGTRQGLLRCPADEDPTYRYIDVDPWTGSAGLIGKAPPSGALEKAKQDTFVSRRGQATLGQHIEPISYAGCCDTLGPEPWVIPKGPDIPETPRKIDRLEKPYCFTLLTEPRYENAQARTYCFRWFMLAHEQFGGIGSPQSWNRHYGGNSPNSNGINLLFADGHAQWHSGVYAATTLFCCQDLKSSPLNIGTKSAINMQKSMCGG